VSSLHAGQRLRIIYPALANIVPTVLDGLNRPFTGLRGESTVKQWQFYTVAWARRLTIGCRSAEGRHQDQEGHQNCLTGHQLPSKNEVLTCPL
jgi:hypothetical protein